MRPTSGILLAFPRCAPSKSCSRASRGAYSRTESPARAGKEMDAEGSVFLRGDALLRVVVPGVRGGAFGPHKRGCQSLCRANGTPAPFSHANAGSWIAEIRTHRAAARENRAVHAIRGSLRKSGGLLASGLRALFCLLFRELRGAAPAPSPRRGRQVPRFRRTRHRPPLAAGLCLRALAHLGLRHFRFAAALVLAFLVLALRTIGSALGLVV